MDYYDNTLSYYKIIVNSAGINEAIAKEAYNYYMNNLSNEERTQMINEMRYATGLLEVLLTKSTDNNQNEKYLSSIYTCINSIILCFANGAYMPINSLFEYMHQQVLELTGYIGIYSKMDIDYRSNYMRG